MGISIKGLSQFSKSGIYSLIEPIRVLKFICDYELLINCTLWVFNFEVAVNFRQYTALWRTSPFSLPHSNRNLYANTIAIESEY